MGTEIIIDGLAINRFKFTLDFGDGRVAAVNLSDEQLDDLIVKMTEIYEGGHKVCRVKGLKESV